MAKTDRQARNVVNIWKVYEREKAKLIARNLGPDDYAAAIQRLCERLGA